MTGRRLALYCCPLIAILLYLPSVGHDFVFDDRGVILQNPVMRSAQQMPRILITPYWNLDAARGGLYRPFTSVTFALDRLVARGFRAWWYHLVNVLLHGVATLLVTRLALALLPGAWPGAFAGLLFALHPVHVEAVSGIVGRADILAACCVIGAVLLHRRALSCGGRLATGGAWAAVFLAVMAKESGVTAALLCGLIEWLFPVGRSAGVRSRRVILFGGYGVVLAVAMLIRIAVLGGVGVGAPIPFVDNPAATAGPIAGRLTALGTVVRYAALLLWPAHLSADYSFDQIPVIRSMLDPLALGGLILICMTAGAGLWLRRRMPAAGFGLLFVAISAAPTSNLPFYVGTLLAERLMYLPSVGICLLGGALLAAAPAGRHRQLALGVCAMILGLAALRVGYRLPEWRNDLVLYESTARTSPRSARIRHNLGNAHFREGRYDAAAEQFRAALTIYPEFDAARVNLGMVLIQLGRPREALTPLQTAAARSPGSAEIAVNLGVAYRAMGDTTEAERRFRQALAIDSESARAWNNLGAIELGQGNAGQAVEHIRRAVRIDPESAIFRVNLGDALVAAQQPADGRREFRVAASLDPDLPDARRGMGEAALMDGDLERAEAEFRAALRGDPRQARAANFLGYVLALKGDTGGAESSYRRALELDPGQFDVHRSLGMLYARDPEDRERAIRHIETSLALAPEQPEAGQLKNLLRDLGESD